jgi:acyl-CoA synthetase (AMP-forming)/AMP-acid ligase II
MQFTLANVIREQVEVRPEDPCLTFADRRATFADLHRRSSQLANVLIAAGVEPGDRVGILSKNHSAFYELAFACSKANAIMMGLNWRLAPLEIAVILEDSEPTVLIVSEEERGLLPEHLADDGGAPRVISLEEDYDRLVEAAHTTTPDRLAAPDDVIFLLYTSGTTGLPKGVMITNRNLSYTRRIAEEFWEFDPSSVHLVASPLFHIGGIGTGLMALLVGGETVLVGSAKPAELIDEIERHRVTHAFFVPAVIQALTAVAGVESADLSSLQLIIYGASPISESVLLRAIDVLGCRFTHAYGLTETAGTVVSLPPEDHDPGGPQAHLLRSCGKAFPWGTVSLFDPRTREEVPTGEVGEIWVRSEQTTKGYWNKPEETAKTLTDEGWLRTGDAAYQDEEGYFYLFDRYKDMLVSGGENVYPAEVENVLYKHLGIDQVAVIGVPHERWGETPKAIVVPEPGARPTEQEVIDFAREHLARYKCPTSVEFVDALPRSASGKVLKKDLRAPYWEGQERMIE